MSFFRYPGGKSKLKSQIISKIKEQAQVEKLEYREPFFGGGSIGLELINDTHPKSIWINDYDTALAYLWVTLIARPDLLIDRVMKFVPSVDKFHQFKDELQNVPKNLESEIKIANYGFKKLAIHQISYSGLGTKSGSPLGGQKQLSKYKVGCRWSPIYIAKKITVLSKLLVDSKCTNYDFENVIKDKKKKAIIYLDPPYFVKGNDLYQYGFTEDDHIRLSEALRGTKHNWVLSYDDCDAIRDLYGWAKIDVLDVNYSITALKDKETGQRLARVKQELLITP